MRTREAQLMEGPLRKQGRIRSNLLGYLALMKPRVIELLKANRQEHVKVFLGGIIPDEDVPKLKEIGVVGIYGPGTVTHEIIQDIRAAVLGSTA